MKITIENMEKPKLRYSFPCIALSPNGHTYLFYEEKSAININTSENYFRILHINDFNVLGNDVKVTLCNNNKIINNNPTDDDEDSWLS